MKEDKIVNNSTEEVIKKDNRKAGWKFAVILLLSGLAGGMIGFMSARASMGLPELKEAFETFMTANISLIGIVIPVSMAAAVVIVAIWSTYNIRYSKKNAFALIEADDAEGLEKIENKLAYNLWGTTLLMIFQYLMFSLIVFADYKYGPYKVPRMMLSASLVFMVGMLVTIVLQQKVVDCTRLINPEKQGSVYDMNFNKKWEASCDEAEKLIIYKSAYKAYRVVTIMCVILWVIFMILGMTTGVGFLSVMTVILIWAVSVCVYSYYSIKFSK